MDYDKVEKKKNEISLLVSAYYNKFDFLKDKPLYEIINKAWARFLNTDMSIEEINEVLMDAIIKRMKKENEKSNSITTMFKDHESRNEQIQALDNGEKQKQYIRNNNQDLSTRQAGYVSKLSFIFMLLLIIVLFLTGFILLNL